MHTTKSLLIVTIHWINSIIPSTSHKNTINTIFAQHTQLTHQDSIRNEWNHKKNNIEKLIKDKKWSTKIKYYQYYLKNRDLKRADSVMLNLSSTDVPVEDRYQISMELYRYNGDSKTQLLFLSTPSNVKDFRAYFLRQQVSKLPSSRDKRTHYFNLVALDSVYLQISKDSIDKAKTAQHYNSLAWYSMLTNVLTNVEYYLNQSKKYDPQSKYYISNQPLLLLLKKRYNQAKALYLLYKDQPFNQIYPTFKDVFLDDFRELERGNIATSDIRKIKRILDTN